MEQILKEILEQEKIQTKLLQDLINLFQKYDQEYIKSFEGQYQGG